jgi:DNA processing protein
VLAALQRPIVGYGRETVGFAIEVGRRVDVKRQSVGLTGATPVTETADIVCVLQPIMARIPAREPERPAEDPYTDGEPAPDQRTRIVALLGPTPVSIDDLVRMSSSSPAAVRMVLLELEIAGRLERHGGLVSLG